MIWTWWREGLWVTRSSDQEAFRPGFLCLGLSFLKLLSDAFSLGVTAQGAGPGQKGLWACRREQSRQAAGPYLSWPLFSHRVNVERLDPLDLLDSPVLP